MENLKRKLEYHYKKFDYSQIYPDPLIFPHRFTKESDIEISAFISSIFAYGNVTQIMNSLEKIHSFFDGDPTGFIEYFDIKKNKTLFKDFKHRFYTSNDVLNLFEIVKYIYCDYESVKHLFLLYYFDNDINIKNSLSFFSKNLIEIAERHCKVTPGIKFMFPDPFSGSACKRMNLFLRWVVRKDELDFGIWKSLNKSQLVIPVDTHIAKISREIGLTKRKNVSWQMAEEITENLKKYDENDPVKYDFAICHIGMRKLKF
ncbi:MAG: TIGR02757 family protein [Ignavibacteriae bacterium]|nr:TIGR02757 family protein [Ignavibacteriota bacterium]MCB9205828.1 TIGR02757 family protein [Ignavibacteriales bacterium]MCB9219296.1 TIGR02757 family protein [Ignavibacteriales bacterium]MCB9260183.1 TIGR02757 family protein [Ignavibacteriales bacterium]